MSVHRKIPPSQHTIPDGGGETGPCQYVREPVLLTERNHNYFDSAARAAQDSSRQQLSEEERPGEAVHNTHLVNTSLTAGELMTTEGEVWRRLAALRIQAGTGGKRGKLWRVACARRRAISWELEQYKVPDNV